MRQPGAGDDGTVSEEGGALSSRDQERAEAIMEAVSDDTSELFGVLRNGMTGRAGARPGGGRDARGQILHAFSEIRAESYQEAAESARRFAAMCLGAAEQVPDMHNRRIARCVAELFDEFASRIDRAHPVAASAMREGGARVTDGRERSVRGEPTSVARREVLRSRRDGEGEEAGIGLIVDNIPRR